MEMSKERDRGCDCVHLRAFKMQRLQKVNTKLLTKQLPPPLFREHPGITIWNFESRKPPALAWSNISKRQVHDCEFGQDRIPGPRFWPG